MHPLFCCREIISEILIQNYLQVGEAGKLALSPLEALNVTVTCDRPLCTHCPIILIDAEVVPPHILSLVSVPSQNKMTGWRYLSTGNCT